MREPEDEGSCFLGCMVIILLCSVAIFVIGFLGFAFRFAYWGWTGHH